MMQISVLVSCSCFRFLFFKKKKAVKIDTEFNFLKHLHKCLRLPNPNQV